MLSPCPLGRPALEKSNFGPILDPFCPFTAPATVFRADFRQVAGKFVTPDKSLCSLFLNLNGELLFSEEFAEVILDILELQLVEGGIPYCLEYMSVAMLHLLESLQSCSQSKMNECSESSIATFFAIISP